jgi:predicted RNase H-like HicB family nuclease
MKFQVITSSSKDGAPLEYYAAQLTVFATNTIFGSEEKSSEWIGYCDELPTIGEKGSTEEEAIEKTVEACDLFVRSCLGFGVYPDILRKLTGEEAEAAKEIFSKKRQYDA